MYRASSTLWGCRRTLSFSTDTRTILAALVERLPILTPELPTWKLDSQLRKEEASSARAKIFPEEYTNADEGPDRKRARLRVNALIEREGSREGKGDREEDQQSLDRKLAQRLYLLLHVEGRWQLPQACFPLDQMTMCLSFNRPPQRASG